MTPETLANLHARTMVNSWSVRTFADFLMAPDVFLTPVPSSLQKYAGGAGAEPPPTAARDSAAQTLKGFALGRVILDEAELLTLVIDPSLQNKGLGSACLEAFEARAIALGAKNAFLEVAESNTPARRLYVKAGWCQTGVRTDYYRTENGREDAIMMTKSLKPA